MHRTAPSESTLIFTPSVEDLLRPYQHFPPQIQNAILAIDTAPQFINLSRGRKAVLRVFLTRTDKSDGTRPILVNFEHAATESGVCQKTIMRTVTFLLSAGWLKRCGQDRDQFGVFTYRRFSFTRHFCDLIDLPTGKVRSHRTSMSHVVNKDHNFKKDQHEIHARVQTQRVQIELPVELESLVEEFSIRPTGIAKLRGIASAAGYKLQDVVVCGRPYLQKMGLKGNRAFRYLQKMCERSSDYATRAAQVEQLAMQLISENKRKQRGALYAGKRFVGPDGLKVFIFENAAEVMRAAKGVEVVPPCEMDRIYDAIENGKLLEQPAELYPIVARASVHKLLQNMKQRSSNVSVLALDRHSIPLCNDP